MTDAEKYVYLAMHSYEKEEDCEEIKLIGVYSTEELGQVLSLVLEQNGTRDGLAFTGCAALAS